MSEAGEHTDQSMLSRISNEIVRAQKEFFGKGPTQAKAYMMDDLLMVVMREGLTTAEKTMLNFEHPHLVRQFRQIFQNEMTVHLTGLVEDITGRKVITYQSQVMFDPDVVIELFVFDSPADVLVAAAADDDDVLGETSPNGGG